MEIAAYFLMEPPTQKPTDNPVLHKKLFHCVPYLNFTIILRQIPQDFIAYQATLRWFPIVLTLHAR